MFKTKMRGVLAYSLAAFVFARPAMTAGDDARHGKGVHPVFPRHHCDIHAQKGWSPLLAAEEDGDRRVLRVVDWANGEGKKPPVPQDGYLGPDGLTGKGSAIDLRGALGPAGPGVVDGTTAIADSVIDFRHLTPHALEGLVSFLRGFFEEKRKPLVLWNKLGSPAEVENSRVGPGGVLDNPEGEITFTAGRFGDGLDMPFFATDGRHRSKVTFDLRPTGMTTEKGTVEFWWKSHYDFAAFDRWDNGHRAWFSMAGSAVHPPQPPQTPGKGNITMTTRYNPTDGAMGFFIQKLGGAVGALRTAVDDVPFRKGEEMHWACAFDVNGIAGLDGKTIVLYKNGVEVASSYDKWEVADMEVLWLGVMPATYFNRDVRELGYGGCDGVYDNLKVWGYAKTDFSDRFQE